MSSVCSSSSSEASFVVNAVCLSLTLAKAASTLATSFWRLTNAASVYGRECQRQQGGYGAGTYLFELCLEVGHLGLLVLDALHVDIDLRSLAREDQADGCDFVL